MAACRAEALSKVYGRRDTAVRALRDITLSIPPNAFTAIMGPSGSGKSTLLHCLAALDTPTSGRVYLGQTELTSLTRRQQAQVRRDRIGFVFQAFNLVPTLDAIENITLPQLLAGRRPNREWLEYVVDRIGLGGRLHHRPSQLSGGQQQRVALARALAGRPEVIFADEPTGNLDTRSSREMMSLLRSAVDDFRQTVVTVTHDPAIAGYADQVLFFTDGEVVDQVLHPEPDLVLEHLQYLDFRAPVHRGSRGQLHATSQPDGQDMRSRRRRRADETGPGRPMVGSDDEVEVARQERWLQRIREQFEAEHEATHTRDEYSDEYSSGYDPDTTHHTSNGYHPDTTHLTSNGYHPDTTHLSGNGLVATPTRDAAPDDGWLPPERSWLSDTASVERASTGRHNDVPDNRSQLAPVVDTHQARSSPEHTDDADTWRAGDWDRPPREQHGQAHPEPDAWTSTDIHADTWRSTPPEADQAANLSSVTPIRSWRDERTRLSADDVWPRQSDPAHDEWSTVAPMEPASGHWNGPDPPVPGSHVPARVEPGPSQLGPPETNGWQPHTPDSNGWQPHTPDSNGWQPHTPETNGWQPHTPETNGWQPHGHQPDADLGGPAATNGDGGWQRWRSDAYAPSNGSTPASSVQHHAEYDDNAGQRDDAHNSHPPTSHHDDARDRQRLSNQHEEPDPQRNGRLEAPRRRHAANGANEWEVADPSVEMREVHADRQSPQGWHPQTTARADISSDEQVVDPVRELLDIWSPSPITPDETPSGRATDDRRSSGQVRPADTGNFGDDPQEPPARPFGSAALEHGSVPVDPRAAGPDEWQSHTAPPADRWDDRPPQSQSSLGFTTDPFEALHSLQSQLNRLGGGRRPPRRDPR